MKMNSRPPGRHRPVESGGAYRQLLRRVTVTVTVTAAFSVLVLMGCQFPAAGAISLEENGPRFMDDWISSVKFSSRVGGKLFCRAHGQPRPVIQWFGAADGLHVQNITGIREVDEDGTLHFHAFESANFHPDVHATSYRCRASNQVGTILSPEIQLRAVVADMPYEIENPDVSVLRGNVAILRCLVPTQVRDFISVTSWIQDSTVNIYPSFQSGKYLLLPNGDLYVFNVDSSDGYKNFACRTSNKLTNEGKTSSVSKIIVKEPESPVVPVRLDVPKQLTVKAREGEDVYLPCGASSGQPPPQYTWFREQDDVLHEISSAASSSASGSVSPSSWHPFPGGPLLLSGVKAEDSGVFICRVNNTSSSDQVRIQLNVYVPLHVQTIPRAQVVDVGRTATFRCTVTGAPVAAESVAVEWLKDGKRIQDGSSSNAAGGGASSRYAISSSSSGSDHVYTLTVHTVHATDAGMYQCFARNDLYSVQDSAQLRLGSVVPELIYRFTEQTLQPGPSVSLKCTGVGNPPPQFTWTLDGYPLPESERFMVGQYVTIHDNVISHVNITGSRDEDGGLVSCEARNAMGSVLHSARLNIYGPPYVRPIPPVKAVAGRTLQIQCPVSGWPIEAVVWTRSGATLPVNRRQRVYANGTLIVEHVHRGEDEGTYECSARNRQGLSSSRDLHLQVIVAPKIMPFQFMSQLLREGMRAAVSCQVIEGDRPFDFSWHFNDKPITSHTHPHGHSGGGGGSGSPSSPPGVRVIFPDEYSSTLVIEVLESGHSGEYACIVENAAGREVHAAQLTVNVPPKWTLEPSDTINVSAGHSVALHCQAQGYPQPSIVWKRAMGMHPGDYKDITTPSIDPYPNGTLHFHEVRKNHEGSYLCEARNGVGSGLSKVVYLKVNAPAQFLERDRATSATVAVRVLEKAVLQCRAGGDLPIEIQWSNRHSKITGEHGHGRYSIRHQTLEESVLSELVITDVTRDDGGAYFCRAGNVYGSDQTSILLNVQEPPGQPVNMRVMEQQSRSVHISWAETFNGNSPLLKYVVQYTTKHPTNAGATAPATWPAGPDDIRELAVPATQTNAKLEPLQPATTYHVRILAQNGMGFGPPSEMLQVTTSEEAPEAAPQSVQVETVGSTRLRVQWEPPDKKFWHGTVLGYYLGYREIGSALASDGDNMLLHTSHPHDMNGFHFRTVEVGIDFGGSAVLDNLTRYTRYIIIAQAFNSQGHGPPSQPVIGVTQQDVPSMAPEAILCSASSPTGLQISWHDPPLEGRHGLVQGYKIKYHLTGTVSNVAQEGPQDSVGGVKMVMSKSTALHGLRKWTNYTVQVLAFTSVGDGVWSRPLICSTDEDVPSPPASIKALVSSRHSVHISWLPPTQSNGVVLNYTLYVKQVDAAGSSKAAQVDRKHFQARDEGDFQSYTVTNLKEGFKYEFWVTAATRVGEGPPTNRVRASPAAKVPARISSFSQRVQVPWKRELAMACETVGIPEPNVVWKFNGLPLSSENVNGARKHVNGAGTLTLTELAAEDGGNYSCTAVNAHGADTIVYSLSVQVPPSPPTSVRVVEASYDALGLEWTPGNDGGSPVRGYMVHYKRGEGGDWEEVEVPSTSTTIHKYTLKGLTCGSKYQFYITTLNRIGVGPPSAAVTAETKGNSPTPPKKADLLASSKSNSSSIAIKLDAWNVGQAMVGCPISKYVVEYKEQSSRSPSSTGAWIRLPHEYPGDAKYAYIRDLTASTKYAVRINAENPAGKSTASYVYQTAASSASKYVGADRGDDRLKQLLAASIDDDNEDDDGDDDGATNTEASALSTSLFIVLPSLLSLFAVTGVILVTCYFRRKRMLYGSQGHGPKTALGLGLGLGDSSLHMDQGQGQGLEPRYCPVKTNDPYSMPLPGDSGAGGGAPLRYKAVDSAGRVSVEDVCPYATFQLPEKAPGRPVLHGRGSSRRKSQGGARARGSVGEDGGVRHTGDTLYTTGHIYSGPYQSVQGAASLRYGGYNDAPTMQMREPDYARIRGGEEDSEVKRILTLHMPITSTHMGPTTTTTAGVGAMDYDYDTLGSDSDPDVDPHHQRTPSHAHAHAHKQNSRPPRSGNKSMSQSQHRERDYSSGTGQARTRGSRAVNQSTQRSQSQTAAAHNQEMVTFRHGMPQPQQQRSDLTSEQDSLTPPTPSSDADDDEGSNSSPGRRFPRHNTNTGSNKSYFSRKSKSASKSSASGSSSGAKRVRSSSGYSSHVDVDVDVDVEEESSFIYDHRIRIEPPRRFSDSRDLSPRGGGGSDEEEDPDEDYEEIQDQDDGHGGGLEDIPPGRPATGGYHHIHV